MIWLGWCTRLAQQELNIPEAHTDWPEMLEKSHLMMQQLGVQP